MTKGDYEEVIFDMKWLDLVVVILMILVICQLSSIYNKIQSPQKTQRTNVYKDYNGDIMSVYSML